MSLPTVIKLEDVSVLFKQRQSFFRHKLHKALDGVSFDVFQGETLGIIGGNGSGKSSVLKILAGIFKPDSGNCVRSNVKVSLQTLAAGFDNELTGRDNAIISSMLLGHSKKNALANLDEIFYFSELNDAFFQPVKTYSSGMRTRLGFSVAITMQADVLLIDEVLGVGDAAFRKKAEDAILEVMNSEKTVVFVSHSLGQIKRLCTRVVWLEKGKVMMVGKTDDVLHQYEEFSSKRQEQTNNIYKG